MAAASYFRVIGEQSDLPLMLWPNDEGDVIVQMGRGRPSNAAISTGSWPDGRSSKE